jgi:carboxyl-terminal processing protease
MRSSFARRLAHCFVAALPFLFCLPAPAQDSPGTPLALNERAYLASRVYASLANSAHLQNVAQADIEAAYKTYLEKVLATGDRFAFSRASMEFLATLHNGHTVFIDMALIQQGGSVPFAAAFIGGQWVVTASQSAGLEPGDVIETIDGQPFEPFFQDRRRLISASTEQWARHALFARLPAFAPYAHLFPHHLVLGLAGGRQVAIDRDAVPGTPPPAVEGRWLDPEKVAYIRIGSFASPENEKRAIELVGEYRAATTLIVDVRGNLGGNTPSELISLLMDRPYRWWTESTPQVLPYFRYRASQGGSQYEGFESPEFLWRSPVTQPSKDGFKGKLALLVDGGCNSSCEDFAMPFKDNGRALLAGETTAGSTGQPYMLNLGNGMMAMIGAKLAMFPDGSPFEGVGIKPDLEVSLSAEDLRQAKDAVLEAARKRLSGS